MFEGGACLERADHGGHYLDRYSLVFGFSLLSLLFGYLVVTPFFCQPLKSQRLPCQCQKKAWEAMQEYVAGSQFLSEAHERAIHKAVRVKPKL